ncbi:MAG: hypothetical protein EPN36_13320 [Rhodanobacteraceae bacterium]|nr:MAG: hypothetical protein EPN36_13320 [Rhodanobacteraceae bacterium]
MTFKEMRLPAAIAEAFPLPSNSEQYLLARYGATMSLDDIAAELGTTPNALRIRQLRYRDLPPRIRGMRAYRCPTKTVAAWITALVDDEGEAAAIRDMEPAHGARRPGRPRKHHSFTDADGGEDA